MKPSIVISLLLVCACTRGNGTADAEPGAMAAASTDPCCTVLVAAKGTNSVLTNTLAKCLMFGATVASCNWPQPKPPAPDAGTGGASPAPIATGGSGNAGSPSTGGKPSVDGKALCIAATKADPIRKREASDNGMTIDQVANIACSFQSVQQCFASGVCK